MRKSKEILNRWLEVAEAENRLKNLVMVRLLIGIGLLVFSQIFAMANKSVFFVVLSAVFLVVSYVFVGIAAYSIFRMGRTHKLQESLYRAFMKCVEDESDGFYKEMIETIDSDVFRRPS